MDFEEFKEQFVDDVRESLYGRGAADVNVSIHEVNKLDESYDAMTVTPVGSNVGVNLNIDCFYEAMNHGASYDEVVDRATIDRLSKTVCMSKFHSRKKLVKNGIKYCVEMPA